jgi:glycyl-tRNA synthetase beta chain
MEKTELVVELGVEEIPAWMLEDAARQLSEILVDSLKAQRLSSEIKATWYTPRRIIVGIKDIPVRQDDLRETVIGPPKSVSYDAQGNPTKAAIAFAQKHGVELAKLRMISTPKGEYLSLARKVRGEKTQKILQEIIPASIGKIQFPKTMYWSEDHFRFARPLRWVVALYHGRVVPFRIADIESSNFTSGHRFLGDRRIRVSSLSALKEVLTAHCVLVDPAEREKRIVDGLKQEAGAGGGHLRDDPELLKTIINLNEYPSVIRGSFEKRFLALPQEILITVMREHQKYFSIVDEGDKLLPYFLAVINLNSDHDNIIRSGHERVLRARLADAAFFWETDRKTTLRERQSSLKNVLFQAKLGSYFDKTQRVLALLPLIAKLTLHAECIPDLEAAAQIFKCDLVTEMVKEFTDLQGIVGALYAQAEGYAENVWRAIYDQYLPKATNSPSPATAAGAILALADRLDTVCGCFSIGLIPSGSKDPLAVRRQGNGILKIILDYRMRLSINQLILWSLDSYPTHPSDTGKALKEFFEGRLRFLFEEMGYAYDCINAALAVGFDDPLDTLERLHALQSLRNEADFLSVASNFKRIMNILAQADILSSEPDDSKLSDPAELALWKAFLQTCPAVESGRKNHDYCTALRALASMGASVNEFFDKVLVMSEDPIIRGNRLALLKKLSELFLGVADISYMVIERSGAENQNPVREL